MKLVSESRSLASLHTLKREFADEIREQYEHRAKPCSTCETPGACCLDEHFVNVRITRLEAVAIQSRLSELPKELREKIGERIEAAIDKYDLDRSDANTYACPLFETGVGCLVHGHAKPLPCIAHACYERNEDLPPDEMLATQEIEIDRLNQRVYGSTMFMPIPVALRILSDQK